MKWFPYNKGGESRRWYGNQGSILNWENDGHDIRNVFDNSGKLKSRPQNVDLYFKECTSWSKVSSVAPAFRYFPRGFAFDVAGTSAFFVSHEETLNGLGFLNSSVARCMLSVISPTLNYEVGHISSLPTDDTDVTHIISRLVAIARDDWNGLETSWDFSSLPLLDLSHGRRTLTETWTRLCSHWRDMIEETQRLEEENNRIFIDSYSLQNEMTSEVPLDEITLTCNPAYRYGGRRAAEPEGSLRADTMARIPFLCGGLHVRPLQPRCPRPDPRQPRRRHRWSLPGQSAESRVSCQPRTM